MEENQDVSDTINISQCLSCYENKNIANYVWKFLEKL